MSSSNPQHFKYLDSARGIAALMVFGSHYIARCFQDKMNVHWFFFVFNGNDAVSFFFVLSGFVLSYQYIVLDKELDVKKFYVKRVFRLFPAYFVIIALSALYACRHQLNAATFRDVILLDKTQFWEEALLFRFHNSLYYPGWTLTIEMLGSFLMPFYIVLAQKNKKLVGYLIVVTLIIGNNIYFSYLFLFGIIASTNYRRITDASFRQTKWYRYRYPLIVAAIVIFSIRQIDNISPFGSTFKYLQDYLAFDFFTYTGLSCFVFLVCILYSERVQRFLENKVLVFLGKISYSIYLVHIWVIDILFLIIGKYITFPPKVIPYSLLTLLVVACVIGAATLMYHFVEIPFMKMGKKVADKMRTSLVIKKDPADRPA